MRGKFEIMTTEDVAQLLGVKVRRVQELAAAGRIPSYRPKGHRKWIFFKKDVASYIGIPSESL